MNVNEVNMAKWIVALRSGKYKQTIGGLREPLDGAMCCLGVACDISGLGSWQDTAFLSSYLTDAQGAEPSLESALLPEAVTVWLGLKSNNPRVALEDTSFGGKRGCTGLNDDLQWPFPKIADALEAEYLPGKKAEDILAAVSA